MGKHPKADLYRQERLNGLTYKQIAEKYGISYQAVADACGKYDGYRFRSWTEKQCVYPNLRRWLNENQVGLRELLRRIGVRSSGSNADRYRGYLRGACYPPKLVIDQILKVTGLTYEQLWEVESPNV